MSFRNTPLTVVYDCDKSQFFTAEIRDAIDACISKYPPEWKQSAVMPVLTLVQDVNGGWLTRELMDDIATYLDMPAISVYEVATFYGMYNLKPQGKHKVCICNSVSCLLRGSEQLIHHIEHKYGVQQGETTADGRFTFKEVECLGACRDAPAVMLDKIYYENLSTDALDKLIDGLE
ncbi:NAD(P)H-dependent oxidoreductase subunit E [Chromatium okenii]|uniref:NADH-quinone oxidoreductase subunit NuoE family protein n=1 Tax=Chromatium okenii TaxID=61644 RepID=UPI0026E98438|nr:NAD(P)H-dependent oxidoreductase subunit E [Chromatium okenii]MBV5308307.1 NAD(P)H-dependent oxidoreductase subunit E [Chromatium okenii]